MYILGGMGAVAQSQFFIQCTRMKKPYYALHKYFVTICFHTVTMTTWNSTHFVCETSSGFSYWTAKQ